MKIATLAIFANIALLAISGSAMAAPPAGEGPKHQMTQNDSLQYQHERRQQQRAQADEQHSEGKKARKQQHALADEQHSEGKKARKQQRAQVDEQHSEGKKARKQQRVQADEQYSEGKVADKQQGKQSKKQKHAEQMEHQHKNAGKQTTR